MPATWPVLQPWKIQNKKGILLYMAVSAIPSWLKIFSMNILSRALFILQPNHMLTAQLLDHRRLQKQMSTAPAHFCKPAWPIGISREILRTFFFIMFQLMRYMGALALKVLSLKTVHTIPPVHIQPQKLPLITLFGPTIEHTVSQL